MVSLVSLGPRVKLIVAFVMADVDLGDVDVGMLTLLGMIQRMLKALVVVPRDWFGVVVMNMSRNTNNIFAANHQPYIH